MCCVPLSRNEFKRRGDGATEPGLDMCTTYESLHVNFPKVTMQKSMQPDSIDIVMPYGNCPGTLTKGNDLCLPNQTLPINLSSNEE